MESTQLNWLTNFIWGIANDALRDLYVRGKYRDVILPMTVIRRLDAVLEPTKQAVLDMKKMLDNAGITNQDEALRQAAGQAFYNTSPFKLRDLKAIGNVQRLKADFEAYLDGFSPNVQEIIENFEFRNQIPRLSKGDALGTLIEKFLDPSLNLMPTPILNGDGSVKIPALDNHAMGTMFEELVRRFNEDNNEEAGEHWTPRDAVKLMTRLMFEPIADAITAGTYQLYDCACGTGGMLTVAEETLQELTVGKEIITHLYGQEINAETYAICKSDMILKGEGAEADNIVGGPEHSTLSNDAFPAKEFDFMLANPPYGKSWKNDLERMGGKDGIVDPRFIVQHKGEELSLLTRSSDGQLLFLANMVAKMNHSTLLGSRIAEVHNGSSLFTGDAGQGESNIRRYIIENDWLEAIVALPLNLFYNTGIATYVWVLSNKKPFMRQGKVQLIDASKRFKPLRKNLGQKNCELSPEDIRAIVDMYLNFTESEESKIFDNEAFGYYKVTIERPLRLKAQITPEAIEKLLYASSHEEIRRELHKRFGDAIFSDFNTQQIAKALDDWGDEEDEESKGLSEKVKKKLLDASTWKRDAKLSKIAQMLEDALGGKVFEDYNVFVSEVDKVFKKHNIKLAAAEKKTLLSALSFKDESAPAVIKKIHKKGMSADPIRGLYEVVLDGKNVVVEYESDSELRDSEQVPLPHDGGIEAFVRREVLPYAPDSWYDESGIKVGYEISFTKHFYKPKSLRSLEEIKADIAALEQESEGMLREIIG